jgi:predicted nucleic acid-binding protein
MQNALVFVDANVVIYSRDRRDELKQRVASEWLQRLWREQIGRTSIQVLNEFYWIVTRKLKPAVPASEAWIDVVMLMDWKPQCLDLALMQRARSIEQQHRLSWWDAMIVAAAQQQGCSILLTADLHHGAVFDGVRVCNPFISQVQERPAEYRVEAVSRHRPRGRPRKAA